MLSMKRTAKQKIIEKCQIGSRFQMW